MSHINVTFEQFNICLQDLNIFRFLSSLRTQMLITSNYFTVNQIQNPGDRL